MYGRYAQSATRSLNAVFQVLLQCSKRIVLKGLQANLNNSNHQQPTTNNQQPTNKQTNNNNSHRLSSPFITFHKLVMILSIALNCESIGGWSIVIIHDTFPLFHYWSLLITIVLSYSPVDVNSQLNLLNSSISAINSSKGRQSWAHSGSASSHAGPWPPEPEFPEKLWNFTGLVFSW